MNKINQGNQGVSHGLAGPQAGPVTPQARRFCESGSLECSGIAPCPQCFIFIMVKVVPPAMRATNAIQSKEQADTFFRTFVESYRQILVAKSAEHSSGAISPPVTTPALLAYLEFRKHFQLGHPALLAWITSLGPVPSSGQTSGQTSGQSPGQPPTQVETYPDIVSVKAPAKSAKPGNKKGSKASKARNMNKGSPLERGDLKRIAEKHAEQSLASGPPVVRDGNGNDSKNGVGTNDPAFSGTSPASGGTGRH